MLKAAGKSPLMAKQCASKTRLRFAGNVNPGNSPANLHWDGLQLLEPRFLLSVTPAFQGDGADLSHLGDNRDWSDMAERVASGIDDPTAVAQDGIHDPFAPADEKSRIANAVSDVPQMISIDTASMLMLPVEPAPAPTITEVLLRSTVWADSYLDAVKDVGLGDGGYRIFDSSSAPEASGTIILSQGNFDQIVIRFSEQVDIELSDVGLVGVLGPGLDDDANDANNGIQSTAYNLVGLAPEIDPTGGFQAVVDISSPLGSDKFLLIVANPANSSSINSPDNPHADNLTFRFNVKPGDISGDSWSDGSDLADLLGTWLDPIPTAHPKSDLNGNGLIESVDLSALLGQWLTTLPAGEPPAPAAQLMAMSINVDYAASLDSLGRFGSELLTTATHRSHSSHSIESSTTDNDTVELFPDLTARTVAVDPARSLGI